MLSKPLLTFGDVIQWIGPDDGAMEQWSIHEVHYNAQCPQGFVEFDNAFRIRPEQNKPNVHLIYRGSAANLPVYARLAKRVLDSALRRISR